MTSRSNYVDLLRFPLAVAIVTWHIFYTKDISANIDSDPFLHFFNDIIAICITGPVVPLFFFISGYTFFLKKETTIERNIAKLKKRLKGLLLPYIIWNTIAIFLWALYYTITKKTVVYDITLENIISCFWAYNGELFGIENTLKLPINGPTWFIRDLILVILTTPILYKLLNRKILLVVILLIGWAYSQFYQTIVPIGYITALTFFSCGAYFSINNKKPNKTFQKIKWLIYILFVFNVFIYLLNPQQFHYLIYVNTIIGAITYTNIAIWFSEVKKKQASQLLSRFSFFIYMSHILICGQVLRFLCKIIAPANSFAIVFTFLSAIIIVIVFSLAAYKFIDKHFPKLNTFLIGGR